MKAAIVTIGDEILIGQIIDTNSAWLSRELKKIGIRTERMVSIPDMEYEILSTLDDLSRNHDLILITGGLGPTSDDITKPALCKYFESELVMREDVLNHLKTFFAKRNKEFTESNMGQAMLPDKCSYFINPSGTAPGMWFESEGKIFVSMPGVPFEMKDIMTGYILPELNTRFNLKPLLHKTLVTSGKGESFIAQDLKVFEERLPDFISLAYLPTLAGVRLRLSLHDVNKDDVLEAKFSELKGLLNDIIVSDRDVEIEQIIIEELGQAGLTLSIAESCTGGSLSQRITSCRGSSKIFRGSLVPYQDQTKIRVLNIPKEIIEKHTATSKETALKMVERSLELFQSDFALATTGFFDGEDTFVYIAAGFKDHHTCIRVGLPYKRKDNNILTCNIALNFLLKFIRKYSPTIV